MKGKWVVPLVLIAVIAVGAVALVACSRSQRPLSNQAKTVASPSPEPSVAAATAGQDEKATGSKTAETQPSAVPAGIGEAAEQDENAEEAAVSRQNEPPEPGGKPADVSATSVASSGAVTSDPSSKATGAATAKPAGTATSQGDAAIQKAAAANKHLFIFFYKEDNEETRKMRKVFDAAVRSVADRAEQVVVDITNLSELTVVARLGVDRAPMPLALVLAPNGAVTGGFPTKFEESQLTGAFVSSGMAKCLKALQENKLVLLCAQNGKTKSNDAAMQGVSSFKSDVRFAKFTEVVKIDPTDAGELKFLSQLKIDPNTTEAVTAFLAPPGAVIAKYNGATDMNTMVAALTAATSGGCGSGGCGPSGCGPTK